jgi:hypothetical protein
MQQTIARFSVQALLLLAVAALLHGCGGGGGGGSGSSDAIHEFDITVPAPSGSTYHTSSISVGLAGRGYGHAREGGCKNNQKLSISWKNTSNASIGVGASYALCACFILVCVPVHRWNINFGNIPLELGNNKITVTAKALGDTQIRRISVFRSEAEVLSSKAGRPALAPPTNGYQFTLLARDQSTADIAHIHYSDSTRLLRPAGGPPAALDQTQLLSDLAYYVTAEEYDFVLFYSLSDWSGWSDLHGPCVPPAQNTGFKNDQALDSRCAKVPVGWEKLRGFAFSPIHDRDSGANDSNTLMAMHKMGQAWGVLWDHTLTTVEGNQKTSCGSSVGAGSGYSPKSIDWYDEEQPGLLQSPPAGEFFNELDLYAMGLMGYEEASAYEFLVYKDSDRTSLGWLSVDDLATHLTEHGSEYSNGDGRRLPDTDISANNLRVLLVLITAETEEATADQVATLLDLSHGLSEAWNEATLRRSALSTEVLQR